MAVLTQLQHKDVILFLIAIKSFHRYVPFREALILDDGSLTSSDYQVLRHHIPHSRFFPISEFRDEHCPKGGTWERLLAISELSHDQYVVQMDSDTISSGPLNEVRGYIQSLTAFAIGTWDEQEVEPMRICSERVAKRFPDYGSAHVQMAAEATFRQLPEIDDLKYLRGCSGFSGFPPGAVDRQFIVDFSQGMEEILGTKWHAWGSEQVMSNVVVANINPSEVLPHPKYSNCDKMVPDTHFVHFVGSCRFGDGSYQRLALESIQSMSS